MAVAIDFEAYTALLMSSLERFSIPSVGSFVWHIERAEGDPRTATLKPPKPILKYEPGNRYLAETVAFLRDHYGLPEEEAKELLEETGRLLLGYLKSSPEINVWKLGKLRKVGVTYKFEVSEETPLSFLEDLAPVSLRATEERVVSLGPASAPTPSPKATPKKEKEKKAQPAEKSRVRQVDEVVSPQPEARSGNRSLILVGLSLLLLIGAGTAAYLILRQRKKTAKTPVEIVLKSDKGTKGATDSASTPPAPASTATPAPQSEKSPTTPSETATRHSSIREMREKGIVQVQKEPKPAPAPSTSPKGAPKAPESTSPAQASTLKAPQPGRHYLIIGAYPSLEEAKAKAQVFAGQPVEFLSHPKKSGWVRLSLYSSTDKQAVEARRNQILAQIPDAWIFTP